GARHGPRHRRGTGGDGGRGQTAPTAPVPEVPCARGTEPAHPAGQRGRIPGPGETDAGGHRALGQLNRRPPDTHVGPTRVREPHGRPDHHPYSAAARRSAFSTTLTSSIARVMGPTPPGL